MSETGVLFFKKRNWKSCIFTVGTDQNGIITQQLKKKWKVEGRKSNWNEEGASYQVRAHFELSSTWKIIRKSNENCNFSSTEHRKEVNWTWTKIGSVAIRSLPNGETSAGAERTQRELQHCTICLGIFSVATVINFFEFFLNFFAFFRWGHRYIRSNGNRRTKTVNICDESPDLWLRPSAFAEGKSTRTREAELDERWKQEDRKRKREEKTKNIHGVLTSRAASTSIHQHRRIHRQRDWE